MQRDKGFVYIVTTVAVGENVVHPRVPLIVGEDKHPWSLRWMGMSRDVNSKSYGRETTQSKFDFHSL